MNLEESSMCALSRYRIRAPPGGLSKTCIMYADDTTIISPTSPQNKTNTIEETITLASDVCSSLNLQINKSKTININFTTTNRSINPKIDNSTPTEPMATATTTKFLGITIDSNLTWHNHITTLENKLSSSLYAIRRIRAITNKKTAKIAYFALFECHIRFGIIAWGSASENQVKKIQILQKRALRTIECLQPHDHCKPYFISNQILTVPSLYILETTKLLKLNPPKVRGECHKYNLRNVELKYDVQQHRLTKTSKTPQIMGSKMFNALPDNLKQIQNNKTFAKKLKDYLIERPYYSLNEFFEDHNPFLRSRPIT
uniref:Reverse transcriptase domain-containing protein n=1 Tax=Cuerna arida TaxID=1464854 RepID=A0A1B6G1G7_9HEMI